MVTLVSPRVHLDQIPRFRYGAAIKHLIHVGLLAMPQKLASILVLLPFVSGCSTVLNEKVFSAKPYTATRECAEIAWDVGAMRYRKYTSDCPAFAGWFSLCELPFVAVADTVVLPVQAIHAHRRARIQSGEPELNDSPLENRNAEAARGSSEQSDAAEWR